LEADVDRNLSKPAHIQAKETRVIRKAIVAIFASVFMLFGQPANQNANMRIFPPPDQAFDELKENLGMSTAQLDQLVEILREQNDALQETYRQISEKHRELQTLLESGSRDLNRIGQLTLDIHTLSTKPPNNSQYRERALAVLSEEQKTKLGPLAQALQLNTPAYQAVTLNLLDAPQARAEPLIQTMLTSASGKP
jgi:ABC-type transporter Mla subunit MlaD